MALTNKERVGRVLDIMRKGVLPFVLREYQQYYKEHAVAEVDSVVGYGSNPGLPEEAFHNQQALLAALDVQACLNLLWFRWSELFERQLGRSARSYVAELRDARNEWAHGSGFTNDEAYRVVDTAARLLKMVNAGERAAKVEEVGQELLRLRFEREAQKSKKETLTETGTLQGLKPWREVVQPHRDVAGGRYMQAEFAADLAQVLAGTAEPEYQEPVEFFRRTYLTEGLQTLLVTGIKRLTGQPAEPVVQLQTSFGGGKTHSMLALYHLAGGKISLNDIPGGEKLAAGINHVDLPEANIAVLVGTSLNVAQPRDYPKAKVNTLWGELAYQLGGLEGYQLVAKNDQQGVSPGSGTLKKLFFQFGPCLVIIDELVAYARTMYGKTGLSGGSFASLMTFVQALTEAIKASKESLLLISIPESDIEVGGDAGRKTLERLSHVVGRLESIWKPVTVTESFEIVRRRLFSEKLDHAARDVVINAFADMYRNDSGEFPSGVAEREYVERLRAAYPIHPELFDRLYQDWSTLDRFQRTRGVLRLMAIVIHQLWSHNDAALLIMPGTMPLNTDPVRNELLRYLPDTWSAVFDVDIDGPEARPYILDGDVPPLGRFSAFRRVARAVFLGSAPSVGEQQVRGLEEMQIRLGCAQPGEPIAVFGDALRRMGGSLTYLYNDGNRYWYDTRPTVNKLARDRAAAWPEIEVEVEITKRLKQVKKSSRFAATHVVPTHSKDVLDDRRVRLVVLPPTVFHFKSDSLRSPAEEKAFEILEQRGNSQRLYKNMLIFLAANKQDLQNLQEAVRDYLAWQSIQAEAEALNLDAQQQRQVAASLNQEDETVDSRLQQGYSWLLVPQQLDPMGEIELQATQLSGSDNFYERAVTQLENDGNLIVEWSPDLLRMQLDDFIWSEEKGWEVKFKQMWDYLARYCYLPRLATQKVFEASVRNGVTREDAPFAYATGKNGQGYHTGVVFGDSGTVYFDEESLLIHPEHVHRPPPPPSETPPPPPTQIAEERAPSSGPQWDMAPQQPPAPPKVTRFYGRVTVNAERVNREVGLIVEEVIQHLTSELGCEVEIKLEIEAKKPDGFADDTVRTVTENGNVLKFENHTFE